MDAKSAQRPVRAPVDLSVSNLRSAQSNAHAEKHLAAPRSRAAIDAVADYRQLKRERKPAGGGDAPAKAERGIKSEPTVRALTDNLVASVSVRPSSELIAVWSERGS